MLKRFFAPKWQHADIQVRQKTLESLDPIVDLAIILQIWADDTVPEIRMQALELIVDIQQLNQILLQTTKFEDWRLVAARLIKIAPQSVSEIIQAFEKAKQHWTQPEIIQMLCESDTEVAEVLLNLCQQDTSSYQSLLNKLAVSAKSIQLRLIAVNQIDDEISLHNLLKEASHKQVLQVVRQKLKDIKEQQEKETNNTETAQRVCDALNRLSHQTWDTQFEVKVNVLQQQWNGLQTEQLTEQSASYQLALAECNKTLVANHQAAEKLMLIERNNEQQAGLCLKIEELLQELWQESPVCIQAHQDAYNLIEKNWQQIGEESPPNEKTAKRYAHLQQAIVEIFSALEYLEKIKPELNEIIESSIQPSPNELSEQQHSNKRDLAGDFASLHGILARWRKVFGKIVWPKDLPMVDEVNQMILKIGEIESQYKKIEISQKKKARQLANRISSLQKNLQQRNLIAANKTSNYIQMNLQDLIGDFKSGIVKKVEALQPALDELRDWHAFATTPKKQSLCEAMEGLINETLPPLEKARQIRSMQEQWHELIASDPNADQEHWDRFKLAADTAYQPCAEFYAQQDAIKANNLQRRMEICSQLALIIQQTNWESADWKDVEKQQRQHIEAWKLYHEVPGNERQSSQKHFDKLINSIGDKLKQQKEANLAERILLVEKANQLLTLEDVNAAIVNAKRLQSEWKEIGVTFFKADREQWQKFRAAIDAIFERRNVEKKSYLVELEANAKNLQQRIEKINQLAKLDGDELKQSTQEFEELCSGWDVNLELPRVKSHQLNVAFSQAQQSYNEHLSGLTERVKQKGIHQFKNSIELLTKTEESLLNADSVDLEALQQFIQDCQCKSAEKQLLQIRLQKLLQATDYEVNTAGIAELEMLALRGEILTACNSPDEYKSQRMALQLEQLQQSLTTHTSSVDIQSQLDELHFAWIAIGMIDSENRLKLEQRLANIFKAGQAI